MLSLVIILLWFARQKGFVNSNMYQNSFTLQSWNTCKIEAQWHLSKADTLGANIFLSFRQVSALDRLWLWDFYQWTDNTELNILFALDKCPL